MNTLAIAVAGLGAGLPAGTMNVTPSPAEVFAGLGALVLATLGVLVVRSLQAHSDLPEAPQVSPHSRGDDLKRAA